MLSADPELDPGSGFPSARNGLLHQRADSFPVQHGKGIRVHDVYGPVVVDKLCGVVARKPEGRLRQVVRAE